MGLVLDCLHLFVPWDVGNIDKGVFLIPPPLFFFRLPLFSLAFITSRDKDIRRGVTLDKNL